MNLPLNHHSDSENAPSAYSTVWKLQLRQSHDTTDGSGTLRVVRKLQIPNRCLQISEISETNVQMNFWQQCSVTNTDVEEEGCDACLTSWYDREVPFLSIPLALPPVTRNYLLLLLDRKLWLSVRSFKPTFNKWQVHFFFLSYSLWSVFGLQMSAPEGDSPQTPTAIKAHPMIIKRRPQPAYRYYNLFPCLLVSFLLACIVQP